MNPLAILGFLFGQIEDFADPLPDPGAVHEPLRWFFALWFGSTLFWLASVAFWIWMLIHCYRSEPDRMFWMWILLLVPFGSVVYFLLRYLPNNEARMPRGVRRWTRGRELERLATAAAQIGNPYQFIQYGDALREVGHWDRAGQAYEEALSREPQNIQALWGAALVDAERGRNESACARLEAILAIDPQYKFGDVSLAYARALLAVDRQDDAADHLERHLKRWRQPEAFFLYAELLVDEGRTDDARRTLQAMLLDINSCPAAIARRYGVWRSRARKLLKKLPAGGERRGGPP